MRSISHRVIVHLPKSFIIDRNTPRLYDTETSRRIGVHWFKCYFSRQDIIH